MLNKLRIALAATLLAALAAVSAVDTASAEFIGPEGRRLVDDIVDIELRVIAGAIGP
jgi:hypothetical protein